MASATPNRLVRIIALGDSLTVGTQSPTPQNPTGQATPYGRFLKNLLGPSAEVKVRGINGELTEDMLRRFERDVISRTPDYVIVLGGSNDLGWGKHPAEIMQNLITMYEASRRANIRLVAVTVPSVRGFDAGIPPRQILNQMIADYCRANQQFFVDWFSATAEPETLRLAESYSNDGLHLTTEGYRLLAELLYREVFRPSHPPSRGRA